MMRQTILCLDSTSVRYPELVGLEGESLLSQPWLRVFSSACEARSFLRGADAASVWVVSCEDVDPINAAAAFKQDVPGIEVCLVAFDCTGSLQSRAVQAGIDAVLNRVEFVSRYACEKRRHHTYVVSGDRVEETSETSRATSREAPANQEAKQGVSACSSANCFNAAVQYGDTVMPRSKHRAFVMPVVSGSGGAGKSTIAALSAIIAHSRGCKTLLLDLDLQFGDMERVLGAKEPLCIDDLLDNPSKLAGVYPQENLPSLIAAPRRFERAEEVAAVLPALLDSLQTQYDVIVANTGGFWAEQHAVMLERSSKTLFLVDQRPSSLCACRRALELCSRCGIATSPLLFVVNRCSKNALYSSIDVSCALRGAPAVELRDGGFEVEELVSAGHPLELLSRSNGLGDSLGKLLNDVLPKGSVISVNTAAASSSKKRTRGLLRSRIGRDAACLG